MTTVLKDVHEGYKATELGKIPIEWEIKTTGELFENVSKKGFENLPVLSVTQENGVVYRDELEINIKYDKKSLKTYKLIEPGQFVISLRSFQGGIEFSNIKGISSPAYTILNPSKLVYTDYFKYLFKSFWFIDKLKGSIIGIRDGKQISYSDFKGIKLPLPPLKEQQKIAEILTTVVEQIENTDQLINKTKEIKKGLMQQLLTKGIGHTEFKQTELGRVPVEWKIKKLDDISLKITDGSHTSPKDIEKQSIYKICTVKHMKVDSFDMKTATNISEEDYFKLVNNGCKPEYGDVLLSKDGTVGKTFVFKQKQENIVLLSSIAIIRVNKDIVFPDYLKYFFENPDTILRVTGMKSGSAIKRIVLRDIKNLFIVLPNILEQQKIAEILSTVDEQIESYEQEKEKYIELKKGIMQQLLTGKIRVTV